MNWKLRDYQKRWCRRAWDGFTTGKDGTVFTRQLGTAATGAGKTVMGAALIWMAIQKLNMRTLFLADTDELVGQAAKTVYEATGLIPSIEKGQERAGRRSHNVVGSIQTISQPKRLETWEPDHFGLVIADEAHLSMADTWQRTLRRFNDGGAWVMGITATPERGDDRDLWSFYENLSDEIGLFELIELGALAPITVETVPLNIDAQAATIQAHYGDDGNEMEEAIEPYWDAIIEEWKARAAGRKTLFFHPGIRASKRFTAKLIEHGVESRHVDGNSPDRAAILDAFERDEFQALNNAQLLMKGYDCSGKEGPGIECVVILRPTQSRVAYQQMVGRGTRLGKGKEDLLLLDFLWEFQKGMRPIGPEDLATRDKKKLERIKNTLEKGGKLDLGDASLEFEREQQQNFIDKLKAASNNRRGIRCDARELGIMLQQPELMDYTPTADWEFQPASDRQKEVLKNRGVNIGGIKTRGEASKLLDAIMDRQDKGLASVKQIGFMAAKGIPLEQAALKGFQEASDTLDQLLRG